MKRSLLLLVSTILLCAVLGGCTDAGFEFSEEQAAFIPKSQIVFPAFSDVQDNKHIAVFGNSYIDVNDGLKVFSLDEITAVNPMPVLEMPVSTYRAALSCGDYMLLDCENEPLRYIDLSGKTAPVILNGRRKTAPSSNTCAIVMNTESAFVLYATEEDGDTPTASYVVEHIDLATNTATDILTATGNAETGTTVKRIDECMGNLMVYGTKDGEEYLREYDRTGTPIGEHPAFPTCMVSEERMLGDVAATEWLDGRLYVIRENGVQVYALDDAGAYTPVTFALIKADYKGCSDGFMWFWNHLSRAVYTLNRQTGEIRTFRFDLAGEALFESTKHDLLFDDAGYVLLRCENKTNASGNRLFLFDITEELYK